MNIITLRINCVTFLKPQYRTFVLFKIINVMENRIAKYIQFSYENVRINSVSSETNQSHSKRRVLPYILIITALILWIIFNIGAIQYYNFQPYILVVMNLMLYCIIACMASPNCSDAPKKDYYVQNKPISKPR